MQENLKMSLFDSEETIELNMEELDLPDIEGEDDSPNLEDGEDDSSEINENEVIEDQDDPEGVDGEGDEEGDESDQSNEDDSPDIYSSFAKVLSEQGLLPSLDPSKNSVKTIDDLTELLKEEIKMQSRQDLISKIGEEGVEALEKGITLAEYQQYQQNVNTLDSVDDDLIESDLELSKKLILEDYKLQGFSDERAQRLLKRTIELGEDEIIAEAKDSLISLKEVQKKQLEAQAETRLEQQKIQAKQQEKIDNDLKNSIYNAKEIIEGVPLSKTIKDKIYQSITKPVGKAPSGVPENKLMKHRRTDPIEFDTKLYYLYEVTNGFKDFSKLASKTSKKAISEFEQALKNNRFQNSGTPDFLNDGESYSGIGPELNL